MDLYRDKSNSSKWTKERKKKNPLIKHAKRLQLKTLPFFVFWGNSVAEREKDTDRDRPTERRHTTRPKRDKNTQFKLGTLFLALERELA